MDRLQGIYSRLKAQFLERGDGYEQCSAIHLYGFWKPTKKELFSAMGNKKLAIVVVDRYGSNQKQMRKLLRSLRWWKVWNRYKAFRVTSTGSGTFGTLYVVKRRFWYHCGEL